MSIIMKVYHHGVLLGQCDAKCYDSLNPSCKCVCYGDHHGVGRNRAVEKLREKKSGWRATYRESDGYFIDFF